MVLPKFLDSLNRRLFNYQSYVENDYEVSTLWAPTLTPVTAALAAHGITDKFENLRVIPMADADEVHGLFELPVGADLRYPSAIRLLLIANLDDGGGTLTVTVDRLDLKRDFTGSDVAGNGATALETVIPAITDAEAIADVPFSSDWGILPGLSSNSLYDLLFIKVVASSMTSADRLRVLGIQSAWKKRKFARTL